MPAPNPPLDTTIAPKGITTAARAERIANERPASAETLSIMPTADDLREFLPGVRPKAKPAAASAAAGTEETEESTEEEEQETTEETEEGAEETTEEGTETAEEEATSEEETTETEEEEEDEDASLPPEAIAIRDKMQKRIGKLTAQKTELSEQLAEAEEQLAAAQAGGERPRPTAANPLAHVLSLKDLDAEIAEAKNTKLWALRNRNGAEIPGKDGATINYDADQVANILANAEAQLDAAPARREWLEHQAEAEVIGARVAPVFYQKGTPQYQIVNKAMAQIPAEVKAWRPDFKLFLVQAMVGAGLMRQQADKAAGGDKGKAGIKPAIAKVPPSPGGRTAPKAPARVIDARATKEGNKRIAGGGEKALAAALEKRLFK
jgi:hypothetical protein